MRPLKYIQNKLQNSICIIQEGVTVVLSYFGERLEGHEMAPRDCSRFALCSGRATHKNRAMLAFRVVYYVYSCQIWSGKQ